MLFEDYFMLFSQILGTENPQDVAMLGSQRGAEPSQSSGYLLLTSNETLPGARYSREKVDLSS